MDFWADGLGKDEGLEGRQGAGWFVVRRLEPGERGGCAGWGWRWGVGDARTFCSLCPTNVSLDAGHRAGVGLSYTAEAVLPLAGVTAGYLMLNGNLQFSNFIFPSTFLMVKTYINTQVCTELDRDSMGRIK